MLIWNFGGYNSKLWMGLGNMYFFFVVRMSAVLRCILFYLKEIRAAKLLVLAKVLDFFRAIQKFCLEE